MQLSDRVIGCRIPQEFKKVFIGDESMSDSSVYNKGAFACTLNLERELIPFVHCHDFVWLLEFHKDRIIIPFTIRLNGDLISMCKISINQSWYDVISINIHTTILSVHIQLYLINEGEQESFFGNSKKLLFWVYVAFCDDNRLFFVINNAFDEIVECWSELIHTFHDYLLFITDKTLMYFVISSCLMTFWKISFLLSHILDSRCSIIVSLSGVDMNLGKTTSSQTLTYRSMPLNTSLWFWW